MVSRRAGSQIVSSPAKVDTDMLRRRSKAAVGCQQRRPVQERQILVMHT